MFTAILVLALVGALVACAALAWFLFDAKRQLRAFARVTDVDGYARAVEYDIQQRQAAFAQQVAAEQEAIRQQRAMAEYEVGQRREAVGREIAASQQELATLRGQIGHAQHELAGVQADLQAVEGAAELHSFGFYRPFYDFTDSEEFRAELERVREAQKACVKNDRATRCPTEWRVEGSVSKGRKMIGEQMKLMIRAFNGECDAAVAKVRYNNVVKMEERIRRSAETINKLGRSKDVSITQEYVELKLQELRLTHEHQEFIQQAKEEQRLIKEQMREEQKAQEEIEKVQQEAEKEEARYQQALAKAQADLLASTGAQAAKLEQLVAKLQNELSAAIDKKAKAIARAQLTRSGHIYVISNIGSFGEGVFKIGMTRRLEPLVRVKELGDASVPFLFDVHAMVYSEDAPALERTLHQHFHHRRVNRVNERKEFFRVSLDEVRLAVEQHHGVITFVTVPEAEEYRKTVALEAEAALATVTTSAPASIEA